MPELKLGVGGHIICSTDEHEVADKAAADIAVTEVVDVGCFEPDSAEMVVMLFFFARFDVDLAEMKEDSQRHLEDNVFY